MTPIGAVIFDLDGVLIDSEPVWEEVRRQFVAEHGGSWLADTQSRLMGMSTSEWAGYLAGELGVRMSADEVAEAVIAQMVARYEEALPLIPGSDEAVRALGLRWPLGLASSSPRRLVDAVLAQAGLTDLFAVTLSTEQVAHGKPSPEVYITVADRLGQDPARCIAVEDSNNGVRAAVSAGMRTIAVERPEYPLDPGVRATAILRLETIEQLTPEVIETLTPSVG